jgi:2-keto-4-pentenoate hydratase/2-oxohepta-3-ene-1,7-dioic acid hydratase in catechol pathway
MTDSIHSTGEFGMPSKIICVGRNYHAHAEELGNDVPEEPLLFLKPPSSIIGDGDQIVIPDGVGEVHYEGEIGVRISESGRHISEENAWAFVDGIMPVNDVTARQVQRAENQWFKGKGFDTFCPLGDVFPSTLDEFEELVVVTRVNGHERQKGMVSEMIFAVPFLIAYISRVVTLERGDIVVTGTPAGVGSLSIGDIVEVELIGRSILRNSVVGESVNG